MEVQDPDTGKHKRLNNPKAYIAELEELRQGHCNHEGPKELRVRIASNGATHFTPQCLVCGAEAGTNVPKRNVKDKNLRRFDESLSEKYEAEQQRKRDAVLRKHLRLQEESDARFSQEYQNYLKSQNWRSIRDKVIKRAGGVCEGCGDAKSTDVHHLTYEHVFNEFLFELAALCRECHRRIHENEGIHEEEESDADGELYDGVCNGCRWGSWDGIDPPMCVLHEIPSETALAADGPCGQNHTTYEPLR